MPPGPQFNAEFRRHLRELLVWRRDVRRFRPESLPEGFLGRLLDSARLAPSVGLSEPWRFVVVDDPTRRAAIHQNFEACNREALNSQSPDRGERYAKLKLAGLDEAPCHLAVFADRSAAQGHGLGRKTMPETVEYSAVTAVHTMWLVARAENVGVGWVSILEPKAVASILDVSPDWTFIAYLCIGYPAAEDDTPDLEREGWERRQPLSSFCIYR